MELILGILGLLCALYFALLVSIGMDFSWIWLVGAVLFWGIAGETADRSICCDA